MIYLDYFFKGLNWILVTILWVLIASICLLIALIACIGEGNANPLRKIDVKRAIEAVKEVYGIG